MSTPVERSRAMLAMITAAADAVKILAGTNSAAAAELAALVAAEVHHVVRQRRERATRARAQRRAKRR